MDAEEVGRGELIVRAKLNMAVQAEIVLERRRLLAILAWKLRRTISLG